ncbi:NUDIX hydrolase, partial [Treponema sp. R80B11-R83G3]
VYICKDRIGNIFEEIKFIPENSVKMETLDYPLTHALVVAKNKNGYLLIYNTWKNYWELPGGIIEEGESMRKCAEREMLEETNQIAQKLDFLGLMKFNLKNNKIEYGGLYRAFIENERPFIINDETNK